MNERTREPVVRVGAGSQDEPCARKAHAARLGPRYRLPASGCPTEASPLSSRRGAKFNDFLTQAGGEADVLVYVHGYRQTFEDRGARYRASFRQHQVSRRDDAVFLALQGRLLRLRLRSRKRGVVARCVRACACHRDGQPHPRPRAHRRPQHGHHAGARKPAPALWAPGRLGRGPDWRRDLRIAGHRHGHFRVVDEAHGPDRPARSP